MQRTRIGLALIVVVATLGALGQRTAQAQALGVHAVGQPLPFTPFDPQFLERLQQMLQEQQPEPVAPPDESLLASVPDMFGDGFFTGGMFQASTSPFNTRGALPLAGGNRLQKIAEQNTAYTVDRFFIAYNHFHNALQIDQRDGTGRVRSRRFHVDRGTVGFEKKIDPCTSVGIVVPFSDDFEFRNQSVIIGSGGAGNIMLSIKRLLLDCPDCAISAGLGLGLPTGSHAKAKAPIAGTVYELENEAFHFLPFLAAVGTPCDDWFFQAFAQLDIAANGNTASVRNAAFNPDVAKGVVNDQTLFHFDVTVGRWLIRNDCECGQTGLAALVELHYSTALEDADIVRLPNFGTRFGNLENRFDLVNFTTGLHWQATPSTALRVAAVFPVDKNVRAFDSEIIAAIVFRPR